MSRASRAVLLVALLAASDYAVAEESAPSKVDAFVQLLIKDSDPTLAEHSEFSGECGGESELEFELQECRSRGWDIYSASCVTFTRQRCLAAAEESSLELYWLRRKFSTVGKTYRVIDIKHLSESESIYVVEVEIGDNTFLLYYDARPNPPGGLAVGVISVNNKKLGDFGK